MDNLVPDDLERVVDYLPARLAKAVVHRDFEGQVFVAGGYVRAVVAGERPSDVDVFTQGEETSKALARKLGGKFASWGYKEAEAKLDLDPEAGPFVTEFATSGVLDKLLVQIIHRWTFEEPEDILQHFDFTVTQAVVWYQGGEWRSACTPRFYPDVASKRIHYVQSRRTALESVGTLHRLMKYVRKGYNASPETVTALVVDAYESAEEQAVVGDTTTGDIMLTTWRGIDPRVRPSWADVREATE